MWFALHASIKCLPEPRYASWLTISLTYVPADMRRPSAAVLHPPRNSDIGKVQVCSALSLPRGLSWSANSRHSSETCADFAFGLRAEMCVLRPLHRPNPP